MSETRLYENRPHIDVEIYFPLGKSPAPPGDPKSFTFPGGPMGGQQEEKEILGKLCEDRLDPHRFAIFYDSHEGIGLDHMLDSEGFQPSERKLPEP